MTEVTPEIVREFLDYDPETGLFTWKERARKWFNCDRICNAWNARHAGKPALNSVTTGGYLIGDVFNRKFKAHRVAFAWFYNRWPEGSIDHANQITSDNRIVNLLESSHSENGKNQKRSSRNTSGFTGVTWHKGGKKWFAQIHIGGKCINLGLHENIEDAVTARKKAEQKYGFSPLHGS